MEVDEHQPLAEDGYCRRTSTTGFLRTVEGCLVETEEISLPLGILNSSHTAMVLLLEILLIPIDEACKLLL